MSAQTEIQPPVETTAVAADAVPAASAEPTAAPAGFAGGRLLSETVSGQLRRRQAGFGKAIGARLTAYLRAEVAVRLTGVQAVSFARFVDRLATPTQVMQFRLEPWRGIGLLEWSPNIALRIVDCQLGGAGRAPDPERPLTEIEVALLDYVGQMWFEEWRATWPEAPELKPVLLGHEVDARFLNATPREALMLELGYELSLNEKAFPLRLGFPLPAFEPLFRAWEQAGAAPAAAVPAGPRAGWNPVFDPVPVEVAARCAVGRLTARQIAGLSVGDTLEISAAAAQAVTVGIGGAPKFTGVLGQRAGRWAVQLATGKENQ